MRARIRIKPITQAGTFSYTNLYVLLQVIKEASAIITSVEGKMDLFVNIEARIPKDRWEKGPKQKLIKYGLEVVQEMP